MDIFQIITDLTTDARTAAKAAAVVVAITVFIFVAVKTRAALAALILAAVTGFFVVWVVNNMTTGRQIVDDTILPTQQPNPNGMVIEPAPDHLLGS